MAEEGHEIIPDIHIEGMDELLSMMKQNMVLQQTQNEIIRDLMGKLVSEKQNASTALSKLDQLKRDNQTLVSSINSLVLQMKVQGNNKMGAIKTTVIKDDSGKASSYLTTPVKR